MADVEIETAPKRHRPGEQSAAAAGEDDARHLTTDGDHPLPVGLCARRESVVLLGDSITQRAFEPAGWGAALAHHLQRRADVFNRGMGGYNSRWGLHLLPSLFPPSESGHLLVTVGYGANDAAVESEAVHVPVDEYKANLKALVAGLRRVARHVVLVTCPPVCEAKRLAFQKEKYGDRASGKLERTLARSGCYAAACVEAGKETGTPVLDVWTLLQRHGDWARFLVDGVHLTAEGQMVLWEGLRSLLDTVLPPVESIPSDWPWGQEMHATGFAEKFASHVEENPMSGSRGKSPIDHRPSAC